MISEAGFHKMNASRSRLYLAHSRPPGTPEQTEDVDNYIAEMRPEEAAEYIAALLSSVRVIAAKAQLRLLADLLSVAEEEARFNYRAC